MHGYVFPFLQNDGVLPSSDKKKKECESEPRVGSPERWLNLAYYRFFETNQAKLADYLYLYLILKQISFPVHRFWSV